MVCCVFRQLPATPAINRAGWRVASAVFGSDLNRARDRLLVTESGELQKTDSPRRVDPQRTYDNWKADLEGVTRSKVAEPVTGTPLAYHLANNFVVAAKSRFHQFAAA